MQRYSRSLVSGAAASAGNAGLLHQGKIKGTGESAQRVQQTLRRVLEVERTVAAAADAAGAGSESVDADQQTGSRRVGLVYT